MHIDDLGSYIRVLVFENYGVKTSCDKTNRAKLDGVEKTQSYLLERFDDISTVERVDNLLLIPSCSGDVS